MIFILGWSNPRSNQCKSITKPESQTQKSRCHEASRRTARTSHLGEKGQRFPLTLTGFMVIYVCHKRANPDVDVPSPSEACGLVSHSRPCGDSSAAELSEAPVWSRSRDIALCLRRERNGSPEPQCGKKSTKLTIKRWKISLQFKVASRKFTTFLVIFVKNCTSQSMLRWYGYDYHLENVKIFLP